MMLSIQISATLMRVFFTRLFPSWMSPLQPLIVANSSVHSAASFVRLMFLPQWILCFSTAQHYRVPFCILLQFLLHSCRTQLIWFWYHLNPTRNPSMKVPALCSKSRMNGQCYCPGWINSKEYTFILVGVSVRSTGLQEASWIPEAMSQTVMDAPYSS